MSGSAGRRKRKIRWSKLYSYGCFRPPYTLDSDPGQQLLGQPGFSRVVFCNEPQLHKAKPYKYPKNYVSTTKYSIVTFLPKAFFEQFRRVANLYFLLAAVLSSTYLAPFNRISVIAPLVFVVGVSMIKEAVEDWHRFLQDLNVNSRTVSAHVGGGLFVEKTWQGLCVGDVVKVNKNEYFPSDLLLLSSSFEDGICYVETMNLDGETNLKCKRSLEATLDLANDQAFSGFKATIRCEDPNPHLYTFVGNFELNNVTHPLCPATLLLRDSKLRNTDYIYGVVVFSGPDTKAVRNSTRSPSKRSRIERKMDLVIYLLFSMLLLISVVTSTGFAVYLKSEMAKWWYLSLQDNDDELFKLSKPQVSGFFQFVRALILYGYLIPISLYVSIEVVKVLQAMLINKDIELYDEVTCKSVQTRTSNLNEELGQVEMILTDKTGTLTCNQMEFRKCSIAGVSYGGNVNKIDCAASKRMNVEVESYRFSMDELETASESFEMFEFSVADASTEKAALAGHKQMQNLSAECSRISSVEGEPAIKGFNFRDDRLMKRKWIYRSNLFDVTMFFRVMALCHTGIPVEGDQAPKLKYEAESPEEVSFLIAAQEFGFQFFQRSQSVMHLKEFDPSSGKVVERKYKLLNLLEFCSARKRMSVIVSNEDGEIFLLCKGADNIIFDMLADNGRSYQQATTLHLSDYAEDGFRTLAFAYRKLDAVEYEKWNSTFTKAKTTIGPEREEVLIEASAMIEKELILLGVVAVEDKLQKGVPECIDKLAQAGIKIWLLTGDKKETAINIGFACSLLRQDMKQFHLILGKKSAASNRLKEMKEDILNQLEGFQKVKSEEGNKDAPLALIVDGKALEIALRSDVKDQFLPLAVDCASVICCRVSPKQKALITRLVKKHTGKTTLAIGDGANDVGMIQEADIGVGISGMEGMQAVMASDISLPQFRFLGRLLIVHGHWCYKRISKMILYFVYKNIAFGLTLFYYEVYTRFSGEVLYDDWYMALFNVILTSLPVISLGVLEQDVSSEVCLKFPALYQQGQKNIYFTWSRIIGWILNGIVASLVIFLANICTISTFDKHGIVAEKAFNKDGHVADITHLGAMTYTCIIWTVNCQIALIITHFTWIQHLFIWGSIVIWYIFLFFYGALPPAISNRGFRVLVEALGPAPIYWLVTLLVVVAALLPYFIHIAIQRSFYPLDDHVIQEMKFCRKDIGNNNLIWEREQNNSVMMTQIGFSARVDARIKIMKENLNQKRQLIYRSVTSSPIFRSLTSSPM
ncbi:PREDICTED: putative phospholipid-transporting ATPase 4 [Fragaria vesca subsp. vesca]|uniref:putative phospholipid-transporting ATPase 4 n=1 Tax=Fragaria vesca subsp. vesca TaxID=101020 RepID=UPI0002C30039|nr:PREDICTED: putative phospholipid-transporting ATPase 4 [Fragaria vesca subsp. vesca]